MVFPNQTNHYGTLFGGHALALMDKAAFIAASRYCRQTVVTASTEKINFHSPIKVGQLAECVARVIGTGRSSMQVEVSLFSEDPLSGNRALCTRGVFIMVALNEHGQSIPIQPQTNSEQA
ncbi:MAG: acyl-CoA thioesterase [Acidobacteria bacterium]|nr:acyl-CoA thioesterase [Acidobacteriota bacterium]MCB9397883.1 acyl-CoA thioesterase [Acidobacteriota bacterium]